MSKRNGVILYVFLLALGFCLGWILYGERPPKPIWNDSQQAYRCPAGYQVVSDESAAAQGKDSAHCAQ
jgi:hypothetical protein